MKAGSRRSLAAPVAVVAILAMSPPAVAAPGDLDPSFHGDGKLTTNLTPGIDEATDVAIQADGKIVVVGGAAGRFAVARYLADGTLDDTFSGNGKVQTDFRGGIDRAQGVAIQPNGKIVVAGIHNIDKDATFALTRYLPDGGLDPAFSGNGKVKTNFTRAIDGAHDVDLQEDGRIVASGFAHNIEGHTGTFALARYRPNGTLDPAFSGDGKTRTNFSDAFDGALSLVIQEDGRLVAAGGALFPEPRFALARYRPGGSLDPSFGTGGRVTTNIGPGNDVIQGLALQPDGRLVAAGQADEPDFAFALARYNPDGSLDDTFSGNGKVRTGFGPGLDQANDVVLQDDGRIVAAGFADAEDSVDAFALVRYETDGSLDGSFGSSGKVTTDFTPLSDRAQGVALQADGRIVAAGVAEDTDVPGADPKFALARYLAA